MAPKVCAYAIIHGQHNFMKRPFIPLGCPVQMHNKPDKRGSWDPHSVLRWNLGTSMKHHWILNFFAKATRVERVLDTIFSKHKYLTQPTDSPEDATVTAAHQFTGARKGNAKGNNEELEALFEEIASDKAELAKKSKLTGNGIRKYPDNPPRVEGSQSPRVEQSKTPRVPDRLVVACPRVVVESNVEQPKEPPFQRRSRRVAAQSFT